MGFYVWYNESDKDRYLKVSDSDLQELFNDAKELDPSLFIFEYKDWEPGSFWKKGKEINMYNLYHSTDVGGELLQSLAGSGDKSKVSTYLYGVMNGVLSAQRL